MESLHDRVVPALVNQQGEITEVAGQAIRHLGEDIRETDQEA